MVLDNQVAQNTVVVIHRDRIQGIQAMSSKISLQTVGVVFFLNAILIGVGYQVDLFVLSLDLALGAECRP